MQNSLPAGSAMFPTDSRRTRDPRRLARGSPFGAIRSKKRAFDRRGLGVATVELVGLREIARGEVIAIGDDGYEDARIVYNAMIDLRPEVIIRARDAGDVIAGVNAAREAGVDLSVRGGGHSVPGFGTNDA